MKENGKMNSRPNGLHSVPNMSSKEGWVSSEHREQLERMHGGGPPHEGEADWVNDAAINDFLDPHGQKLVEAVRERLEIRRHFPDAKHGTSISFRIDEAFLNVIDRITQHREVPYETRSDFFREAAYHYAQALRQAWNDDDPEIARALNQLKMHGFRDSVRYEQECQRSAAEGLKEGLLGYYANANWVSAFSFITSFYLDYRGLPSEYADPYLTMLKTIPICRVIAWHMRESHTALPPEFTPESEPEYDEDELYGNTGIPVPVYEDLETRGRVRGKVGRPRKVSGGEDDDPFVN